MCIRDRDYIVNEAVKIATVHQLDEVLVDKYGENASLIPLLQDAGLTVRQLDTMDMRNGSVAFQDALINGRVKHRRADFNVPLDVAGLGAVKRFTNEQFVFSQSRSTTDITCLRGAIGSWWLLASRDADYDPADSFF